MKTYTPVVFLKTVKLVICICLLAIPFISFDSNAAEKCTQLGVRLLSLEPVGPKQIQTLQIQSKSLPKPMELERLSDEEVKAFKFLRDQAPNLFGKDFDFYSEASKDKLIAENRIAYHFGEFLELITLEFPEMQRKLGPNVAEVAQNFILEIFLYVETTRSVTDDVKKYMTQELAMHIISADFKKHASFIRLLKVSSRLEFYDFEFLKALIETQVKVSGEIKNSSRIAYQRVYAELVKSIHRAIAVMRRQLSKEQFEEIYLLANGDFEIIGRTMIASRQNPALPKKFLDYSKFKLQLMNFASPTDLSLGYLISRSFVDRKIYLYEVQTFASKALETVSNTDPLYDQLWFLRADVNALLAKP